MNRIKITASEWCTYAAAAEMLEACLPIVGSQESTRTTRMVAVEDVSRMRAARKVVGRG